MDLQETIVLIIKRDRERGGHLATNYGPIRLQKEGCVVDIKHLFPLQVK